MPDPHAVQKQTRATATAAALVAVYEAAQADVLERLAATGDPFRTLRRIWRDAVQATVAEQTKGTASEIGTIDYPDFDADRLAAYLDKVASSFADNWERNLNEVLDEISAQIDATYDQQHAEVEAILAATVAAAPDEAGDLSKLAGNFGAIEAAKQSGRTTKTWHDPGDNNRKSHQAMEGLTIPIDGRFPNGLRYPHSPGPPAETVNCDCYLTFGEG